MNKASMTIDTLINALPAAKQAQRVQGFEARNRESVQSAAAEQPAPNTFAVTLKKNMDACRTPDPKTAVAQENKASLQAAQSMAKTPVDTKTIDCTINDTANIVKSMLEKLGITVSPETLAKPGMAKQLLALVKTFLDKIDATQTQEPLSGELLATRIEELFGSDTPLTAASVVTLLSGLKEKLTELKNLVDIKEFVVENAKNEKTGAIPMAAAVQETPAANAPAQADVRPTEAVTTGAETQETAAAPQTQTPGALNSGMPDTDAAIMPQPQAENTVPQVQEQDTKEKNTLAINPAPAAEATPAALETVPQDKPETIEGAQVVVQIKAAVKAVSEKQEKPDTQAITGQTENADQPETFEAKELASAVKQDVAGDLPKKDPEAKQEPGDEKNPFIKNLTALKESLAQVVAAPRTEPPQATAAEILATRGANHSAAPNAHEKEVIGQIISRFQLFKGTNGSEINIQLKPEHLGQVRISLDIERNIVFARMQVENENLKHIVENNVQSLKTALEESGIKVERFEVSVGSGDSADFFRRDLAERGRRMRGSMRMSRYASTNANGLAAGAPATGVGTGRKLGYNTVEFVA